MTVTWSDAIYARLIDQLPAGVNVLQSRPIPQSTEYPIVVFDGASASTNNDLQDLIVETIVVDLFIYTRARSVAAGLISTDDINILAAQVKTAVNQFIDYTIDGVRATNAFANPPIVAPTDDSVHGRVVTLNLRLEKLNG